MKELVKCKACGFIMEKGKVKDKCPACGVPKKMFEPYISDISEKRALILNAHLHPVIVHVPQSFAFIVLLATLIYFFSIPYKNEIFSTIKILSLILPVIIIASLLSGLLDGKVRFRKVTTPILSKKIFYGTLFFVFSIGMAVFVLFFDFEDSLIHVFFLACNLICFFSSIRLGIFGTSILNSKIRG
jgi:hypothetical protein